MLWIRSPEKDLARIQKITANYRGRKPSQQMNITYAFIKILNKFVNRINYSYQINEKRLFYEQKSCTTSR
ncbi:hypothetical protein CWE24_09495 [Pseudidiomarina donghaiensis]|uniref:Uncharacterized protein n=1 Tax=Pseudidiomarina donghaiensis TaxID=519452 RepID=A0A432XFY7_9GAMM|nr:hypothetical protein CWE24_09495 [Pseudidiomarina donghaiensis]